MEKRKLNIIIFIVSIMCSAIAMVYLPDILPSYFDAKGNIILNAVNIKVLNSAMLIFVIEIFMIIISWQYNILIEKSNKNRRRRKRA